MAVLGAPLLGVGRLASGANLLCDLGKVTSLLWFSVSLSVNRGGWLPKVLLALKS